MTTQAPKPLSEAELADTKRRMLTTYDWSTSDFPRLFATIAHQAEQIEHLTNLVRECAQTSCEGYCGTDLGMVSGIDCYGCQIIAALTPKEPPHDRG